ncbi:HNH endonuclease [Streptomyces xanthochromogenes]
MAEGRPEIPTAMKRAVLVEAGHRCAIPVCRQSPVQLAHITPWAKVRTHTFDNLIALCPNCHARYDRGDIDRQSMYQYKANLEVLNSRYTDTELQVLKVYAKSWGEITKDWPTPDEPPSLTFFTHKGGAFAFGGISIHASMWWLLSNLVDDGVVEIERSESAEYRAHKHQENPDTRTIYLTNKGCRLVERIVAGEPL